MSISLNGKISPPWSGIIIGWKPHEGWVSQLTWRWITKSKCSNLITPLFIICLVVTIVNVLSAKWWSFCFGFNVLNDHGVALRIMAIIFQTRCFQMKSHVSKLPVSIDMCLIKYMILKFSSYGISGMIFKGWASVWMVKFRHHNLESSSDESHMMDEWHSWPEDGLLNQNAVT